MRVGCGMGFQIHTPGGECGGNVRVRRNAAASSRATVCFKASSLDAPPSRDALKLQTFPRQKATMRSVAPCSAGARRGRLPRGSGGPAGGRAPRGGRGRAGPGGDPEPAGAAGGFRFEHAGQGEGEVTRGDLRGFLDAEAAEAEAAAAGPPAAGLADPLEDWQLVKLEAAHRKGRRKIQVRPRPAVSGNPPVLHPRRLPTRRLCRY